MADIEVVPTGCESFDRGRALLADGREDEALDAFDLAVLEAGDDTIRAAAAAALARLLLGQGRHREARTWAEAARRDPAHRELADVLEAAALVQAGDCSAALALLAPIGAAGDGYTEIPASLVRLVRGHASYVLGRFDDATTQVLGAFADDAMVPDVWAAFAAICAETDFDPRPVVAMVDRADYKRVLGWLDHAPADGVDRIVEAMWGRNPGDRTLLAFATAFAPYVELSRALEWSARIREAGASDHCPLIRLASARNAQPAQRVRAAIVAAQTFGDERAAPLVADAAPDVPEEELGTLLHEVLAVAPDFASQFVVDAATTTRRCLVLAVAVHQEGAIEESLALLVRGLAEVDDDAANVARDVGEVLPPDVAEAFAREAEARDAGDVAVFIRRAVMVHRARQ
jgi:tetratricopeptide (TPR) repeat protein